MKLIKLKNPYVTTIAVSVVITLVLILFYFNLKNRNISTAFIEHTQKVIKNSDELLADIVNHQSGVRGYLLTSDTSFLEPYNVSLPNLKLHFNELNRLTKENLQQQNLLDTLETLINQRIDLSKSIKIQNQAHQLNDILKASSTRKGKIITDKIKAILIEINNTEDKLLAEKKDISNKLNENNNLLFLFLSLGSFIVLIFSVLSIRKNEKRTIRSQLEKDDLEANAINLESEKENAVEFGRQSQITIASKQQFLSNMSHEIRTPMTAIIGFAKVVLKTDLTEKQKEYITAIKTSGDALLVVINDILDLAKVDSGKMTFDLLPFNLKSSISIMLHLFDIKFQEKRLKLVTEFDNTIPELLLGDSGRLNQIMLNLISNAIKFTPEGEISVRVHLKSEDVDNVNIEFVVADTGIGIPENMLTTIFENFEQAKTSTARLFGGTGLGLAIVKKIVEKQGGAIEIKSKIGEGSTFSFLLGFKKCKDETPLSTGLTEKEFDKDIKNLNVLVVEDVALNQFLLKIILDDFGFECDIANNGKIAIEKLQSKSFDIILMDLQMPEMNGIEATEYIRNKMNSKIPIIALTADVTMEDLEKCKAVGMNSHITKPIDDKKLYDKIVELVQKDNGRQLYDK